MNDTVYCYPPDYQILRNKLNLHSASELDFFEREFVTFRAMQDLPRGDFDLDHLRALHFHLFQDIYEWAGDVRCVEISKGGSQFQFRRYIETGMGDVHRRIQAQGYLRGLSAERFSYKAGDIIGDVNYIHPFREGNGRTQLYFLKQLAQQAGHNIDLTQVKPAKWMVASRIAHRADYRIMRQCILDMIVEPQHRVDRGDREHGD